MIILNQSCILFEKLLKPGGNIITDDSKIPEYKNLKKYRFK